MPSASVSQAPEAEVMKRGVPPTALNARTGEFTPPGVTARARSKSASLAAVVEVVVAEVTDSLSRRGARQPQPAADRAPGCAPNHT
ncbi:hypothetical protein NOCA1240516 [metagenome]|uniref:Uncharacterized protein n=1 Tax=metagenome TaxID=256318 RepID=A0A2P2CHE1_9ZZZZ